MTAHRWESQVSALRGHAISFSGDPFLDENVLVDVEDALIVCRDGKVATFGPYAEVCHELPNDVEVVRYENMLLCAGFVDAHTHYVQTHIVGAFGEQLIDWLNRYAFVEEQRFSDRHYSEAVAAVFFDQVIASGTTTACTFCATYPGSVDAFFEESLRRGTRMIAGKVMMDSNAPKPLLDTAQSGYEESEALIDRWHGRGRNLYAITPRFALTSTPAQLEAAGSLWASRPGTYMHTHVSESLREIELVRTLFPDLGGYVDVYERYGLLGKRAVLAHGVHLSEPDLARLHKTRTALAHCPTSNLFLGSGLFDVRAAKRRERPISVGLGSDIGAGTSFSLLAAMGDAYKVAELRAHPMDATKLFYLATLGGAEALCLADEIGSINVGKEADLVVLDPRATPLLSAQTTRAESTEEIMFALALIGDERAVVATYVGGELAYERPSGAAGTRFACSAPTAVDPGK